MEDFKNYMTIQEYMKVHDISRQTVYNNIKAGKLIAKKWLNRTLIKEAA
jgi:predicted DNA-binding protein YlxM (UPF0122 family)